MNLRDAAISYARAGLAVLPARLAEKRPALAGWKDYQKRLPTEAEVSAWFANPHEALCIVTGSVSGNLELIDFDNGGELFDRWAKLVGAEAPGLMGRLVIEQSQSGGWHVIYRSAAAVCGNIHLAQRAVPTPDDKPVTIAGKTYKPRRNAAGAWEITLTLIETRGEGGLFLCHPTPGYQMVQGQIENLPSVTAEQRDVLLEAAWSLNELIPPPVAVPPEGHSLPSNPSAQRPGDAFNARGDVAALLVQHGWTLVRDGENQYWRRPGKTSGWSATLKDRVFYVFSSNAAPFDGHKAYGPFAVYTILEHGGDYTRAASALRGQGYGSSPSPLPAPPMVPVVGTAPPLALEPLSVRALIGKYPNLRPPILHGLLREGETMNLISAPKMGKALAIDTPILTEAGWLMMGDLQPGMRVHTADGSLTDIVAVSEIMHGRPCYRVTTKSGATVVADTKHLWSVVQRNHRAVVTTEQLAAGRHNRRWLLPIAGAIQRDDVDLPLDPWLLGYWLGNGSAREGAIAINQQDVDEAVAQVRRAGLDVGKSAVKSGCTSFTVLGLRVILRHMGLLKCKRIPNAYLLASVTQRAALLAGLLDSDSHADTHANGSGAVEFTTTDPDLFFQVLMLVRSLGHKASTSVGRARLNGEDCGHKLRITFAASRGSSPFRFSRRTAALPQRPISQRSRRDAVESVVPVPSVPVKCIQVAHPSGLFLAGHDFVVTHNSWLVTDLALSIATGRDWLGQFRCERGDVLILDNELHGETSANRIPKVANARGIPVDAYADHVWVQNLRGCLQDVFTLGAYFQSLAPGRFKVIILDAFYRFMPRDMDENDNGTMASLYNHIDRYADLLRCSFVLIHHSSKGNQSNKSITDVGAGAGSQSRATDTHMILRPHEQDEAVVLDAAVRSWPPCSARCLRWSFPVWSPADDLDPSQLRGDKPRRKQEEEADPDAGWDARRFAGTFIKETPQARDLILLTAEESGLSARHAAKLLRQAEALGLAHRWSVGRSHAAHFASLPRGEAEE